MDWNAIELGHNSIKRGRQGLRLQNIIDFIIDSIIDKNHRQLWLFLIPSLNKIGKSNLEMDTFCC